jgi:hypothetical protein
MSASSELVWAALTPETTSSKNYFREDNMARKQAKTEPKQEKKSRRGIVIGAIIGLLLILAILFFVLSGGLNRTPGGKAQTLVSVNLRSGPGTNYPSVGGVPANTEVTVVGRNKDGSWLLVQTEKGNAWMTGGPEYVKIDPALLARLPVVEAAPPAYNASNVKVDQVLNQIPLVVHHPDHFTCASHAGLNHLLTLENGNVIGPHSGDFAYLGLGGGNVLFEYSNGTVQLIRDNPIARFEGDQKYLSLEKALEMFEKGQIVWTGKFGEWPARGVPGCDESSKPSG